MRQVGRRADVSEQDKMQWDAALYDSVHRYVPEYGKSLLEWLDARPGERILDLGCGTGALTHEIAEAGASVVGVDMSPEMIGQARQNYPRIDFRLADARTFRDGERFDKIFSNAVLHWVQPPEQAVATMRENLRPQGRLVAEFGGKGNTASVTEALGFNPWYYPSIGEYASLLEQQGLEVTRAVLFDRPTPVPGENGLRDWLTMFVRPALSPEEMARMEATLRPRLFHDGVWTIDYKRLRIAAVYHG